VAMPRCILFSRRRSHNLYFWLYSCCCITWSKAAYELYSDVM